MDLNNLKHLWCLASFPGQFWSSHIHTEREGCPSPAVSVALIGYPGDATVNIVHCEWCALLHLPLLPGRARTGSLSGLSGSLAWLVAQDCRQTDVVAGTVGDASITPTVLLHFVTPEVHSFPMEHCVCLAALRCRGSFSALCVVHTLDLTYASNCMHRQLDRNGSRRWMLNFCCTHIQMMLRTNLRNDYRCDQGVSLEDYPRNTKIASALQKKRKEDFWKKNKIYPPNRLPCLWTDGVQNRGAARSVSGYFVWLNVRIFFCFFYKSKDSAPFYFGIGLFCGGLCLFER